MTGPVGSGVPAVPPSTEGDATGPDGAPPGGGLTPAELARSAEGDPAPPAGLAPALEALWWTRRGDWERAHAIVQADEDGRAAAWVHAHLHRLEGDDGNARYWYRRAGRPAASGAPAAEWDGIAAALLRG